MNTRLSKTDFLNFYKTHKMKLLTTILLCALFATAKGQKDTSTIGFFTGTISGMTATQGFIANVQPTKHRVDTTKGVVHFFTKEGAFWKNCSVIDSIESTFGNIPSSGMLNMMGYTDRIIKRRIVIEWLAIGEMIEKDKELDPHKWYEFVAEKDFQP